MSIIVVLFLLFYVMPTFSGIYAGYGKELPPATRILLSTVDFIKTKIYFLIAGIILLIILLKIAIRSERGRTPLKIMQNTVSGEKNYGIELKERLIT